MYSIWSFCFFLNNCFFFFRHRDRAAGKSCTLRIIHSQKKISKWDKCSNAGSSLYQTQSQEFRQIIASLQDIWSTDLFDAWRRWMSPSWPVWHLEVLCSWRGWWGISSYLRGSSSYGRIIYIWEDIETEHHPQWLCMRGTKLVERFTSTWNTFKLKTSIWASKRKVHPCMFLLAISFSMLSGGSSHYVCDTDCECYNFEFLMIERNGFQSVYLQKLVWAIRWGADKRLKHTKDCNICKNKTYYKCFRPNLSSWKHRISCDCNVSYTSMWELFCTTLIAGFPSILL